MSFLRTSHREEDGSRRDYGSNFVRSNISRRNVNGDFNSKKNCSFGNFNSFGNQNKFVTNIHHPVRVMNFNTNFGKHDKDIPPLKKRKSSASGWESSLRQYQQHNSHDATSLNVNNLIQPSMRLNANAYTSTSGKRDRSELEDDDVTFMSRDEIEKYSPSRKDGIDVFRETHLRYSYCSFIQNLGLLLELPFTTIGTTMVLCHRFFVRRSHASHDRFLIATAALFLASKSEETACPLNTVLGASIELLHKQDLAFLSYLLPIGWFDQYKERVLEAEQMILTTLNFELNVQHPYASLTSVLDKLGHSQSVLVNLALNLVSQGLRSSLWLQFKPHQIAAGAAFLASEFLNMEGATFHRICQEFQTSHVVVQDVAQQLMELV